MPSSQPGPGPGPAR